MFPNEMPKSYLLNAVNDNGVYLMQYSIVNYSQIDKSLFRLEAEFYNSNSLLNVYCFSGEEIIDFVQYGTSKELNEEKRGFPTLRLNEFDSFFIKSPQKYCDKIDDDTFQSLALKKGDVLICRTNGNPKLVGKSAVVPEDSDYAFASYLFRIRPKEEKLLPTTLVTYLNSSIGRSEIEKHLMVSNQANFSPAKFREILIPQFGEGIQSNVDKSIWESFSKHSKSKQIYAQAQTFLLSELGLAAWQSKHQLTFIKNHSETEEAERLDAEYYQPKYEEIDAVLIKLNAKPIGFYEFLDITTGQYCPNYVTSDEGRPYLRGTDLAVGSIEIDNLFCIKPEDQIQSKQAQEGDVVVTRVGTIGLSARIPEECDGGTISDNLIRIRTLDKSKIDSYYLSCFLGSEIGKSLMLRNARGSVQQRLNQETLKEILLPIPEMEVQSKIKDTIIESFNLRKQSKYLLECAKRTVEIAIEQDEQTAIDYIENKTKEMEI